MTRPACSVAFVDISNLAEQAAQLGDIREARSAASSHRSQQELAEDNECAYPGYQREACALSYLTI